MPHVIDDAPRPCSWALAAQAGQTTADSLAAPLVGLDDEEGLRVPPGLSPVVDVHVHLFADRLFDAIWRWFEVHGWPMRYKLYAGEVLDFLTKRGVQHCVALHYAHKPGMARTMNEFMAHLVAEDSRVTGMATVFPGEPGAVQILADAFDAGLEGVKLHCHVQAFSPDDPRLHEIYELCVQRNRPLVMHAGREPKSEAYPVDPYELCAAERTERVLVDHPKLKLVIPHLGADEFAAHRRLLERHDNLWLDSTMMCAGYFPLQGAQSLVQARPDRIMYGTDFPNLPYAWDRELGGILSYDLSDAQLEKLLTLNAAELYGLTFSE